MPFFSMKVSKHFCVTVLATLAFYAFAHYGSIYAMQYLTGWKVPVEDLAFPLWTCTIMYFPIMCLFFVAWYLRLPKTK